MTYKVLGLGWLLAVAWAVVPSAQAQQIDVPASLPPAIEAICPACDTVLPCGSPDVQLGRKFEPAAMQGTPLRAYLLIDGPVRDELEPLLGQGSAEELRTVLAERAGTIRILAVEDDWRTVRLLRPTKDPRAKADPDQQACFADPARSAACCLGDGPRDRGCLPKADPPTVWLDFMDGTEKLTLRYPVGRGEVSLWRGRGTVYWCLAWRRARLVPR